MSDDLGKGFLIGSLVMVIAICVFLLGGTIMRNEICNEAMDKNITLYHCK